MNFFVLVLSFFFLMISDHSWGDEDVLARRIQSHLIIRDYPYAYQEGKQALTLYPDSLPLHEGFIKALSKLGHERELLQAWDVYVNKFPDQKENRELIEEMCWGVLNKAAASPSLVTRLMSLLAAYFSQDAKGVEILYQGTKDSNAAIRAVAVKLAGHFRDAKLKEAVKRLFKEERAWIVRKEVIEAIGGMKLKEMRGHLELLIGSPESSAEEKSLAIAALVELLDEVNREEIVRLSSSNRAGLRLLACQAIAHFRSLRDQDQLMSLAKDHHYHVRAAAFQALGLLRPLDSSAQILALARPAIHDNHPYTAISAAWLLTLYSPNEGCQAFERHFSSDRRDIRILASSALAATGRYGTPLTYALFQSHPDPYVRLNLAIGLIGQRTAPMQAANVLDQVMTGEKEKWRWEEKGIFRAVSPLLHKKKESELEDSTPEMDNQLVRLELLNMMAILKAPSSQESIRRFLSERSWGISGMAASLLLTEGNEEAIELVQQLLQDPNAKIRLQAALILSLWGREENAIQVLEQEYWNVDKEMKERVLEGLGRIGSMRSVPFLIEVLKEPSQSLRIISAMALIQCLNH